MAGVDNTGATPRRSLIKATPGAKLRRKKLHVVGLPLSPIEKKWYAVLRMVRMRDAYHGRVPRYQSKKIARSLGKSERVLNRMVTVALSGCSLERKPGSGRPRVVTEKWMMDWFFAKHKEVKGRWNVRRMVRMMKSEWGGLGSVGTVHRLARMAGFNLTRPRLLPILTFEHMRKRKEFAEMMLAKEGNPINDSSTVFVMIDEKWFVRHRRGTMWVAPGEMRPAEFVKNKLHETKVMFLGALAVPRPEHGFDGGVGLWPIGSVEMAKYNSSTRPAGARVFRGVEMNRELTIKMMQENVVPAIMAKCGAWVKHIVVVMDNAGGHGGGRGDMSTTTLATLNEWAMTAVQGRVLTIEFKAQSPHSPDVNVLDAGAWWSLQVAVDEVDDVAGQTATEIVVHDAVLRAWNTWVNSDRIQKLFDDVTLNCGEIIRTHGGNLFEQPHHKIQ